MLARWAPAGPGAGVGAPPREGKSAKPEHTDAVPAGRSAKATV